MRRARRTGAGRRALGAAHERNRGRRRAPALRGELHLDLARHDGGGVAPQARENRRHLDVQLEERAARPRPAALGAPQNRERAEANGRERRAPELPGRRRHGLDEAQGGRRVRLGEAPRHGRLQGRTGRSAAHARGPGRSLGAGGPDGRAAARTHSRALRAARSADRKSTRLNSSHLVISYAVFCLKKKKKKKNKKIKKQQIKKKNNLKNSLINQNKNNIKNKK